MSRKALKVVVELQFKAVSCPGVHVSAKDDIYLTIRFLGQYRTSRCLPAVFPLLFHEKVSFEKIFRHAVDPGDVTVMLEYESIKIELVQVTPPAGAALATFEEDALRFLFPLPRLVPSFSGVAREVLMTRAHGFPGIAPRLEFSTKTTISECSADAVTSEHPNALLTVTKKLVRRTSSKQQRGASPRRTRSRTPERRRCGRTKGHSHSTKRTPDMPRSHSLSPPWAGLHGNTQRMAQLSLHGSSQSSCEPAPQHAPRAAGSPSPRHAAVTGRPCPSGSPPPPAMSPSATGRHFSRRGRTSPSNGWVPGTSGKHPGPSDSHDHLGHPCSPSPSSLWRSYRAQSSHNSSPTATVCVWEEVQERVRGLLTTPRAVHRLVYGATGSEVDEVLARRSISPGPP